MKKILVLVVSSLVLFSCTNQEKKVEKQVVSDAELTKVCDSLLFDGNTKIKIKLENVSLEGQPIEVDGECVLSLSREK
jgi:hypothetical protein